MLIILLCLLNSLQILHFIFNKNAQNYEVIIVHRLDFSSCPSFSWDHGTHEEKNQSLLAGWTGPVQHLHNPQENQEPITASALGKTCVHGGLFLFHADLSTQGPQLDMWNHTDQFLRSQHITKPFCKDGGERRRRERGEGRRRKRKEGRHVFLFLLFPSVFFLHFPIKKGYALYLMFLRVLGVSYKTRTIRKLLQSNFLWVAMLYLGKQLGNTQDVIKGEHSLH